MIRRLFKFDELNTTLRTESLAGVTTFLTMSYIIFVNPSILADAGMERGAVITATILAAAFGTLLSGIWANVPFAMAPGMGLNAFFAYTLVIGKGVTWQTALGVVMVSGIAFLLLTICGVRARVVAAIPVHLRLAIASGIGLFIALIGLKNMGLIADHPVTLVTLGKATPALLLGLAGLALVLLLKALRVKGALLISIVATTVLGFCFREAQVMTALPDSFFSLPPSIAPVCFKVDLLAASRWGLWGSIFSFMFVDLFDSVGTIVACSYEAGLVTEDGTIRKLDRILEADALATIVGALLGTSTTTTYIESGAGIASGGRSGFANVVTAMLFLVALFATPFIAIVPSYATAPALVVVGVLMFKSIGRIDFGDFVTAVPAFLTIVLMPLTYNISTGLCFGFMTYILMAVGARRAREVSPVMWVIGALATLDVVLNMWT